MALREGIRKGLVDRSIYPVFCVSAMKDMGVRRMMEFLGNVVPFVEDMPAPVDAAGEEVKPDSNGPLMALRYFGSGYLMKSYAYSQPFSLSVLPVRTSLSFTVAPISPAQSLSP